MAAVNQRYYPQLFTTCFIFIACEIVAIVLQQPWMLSLPFAWLLLPSAYRYLTTNAEKLFWLLFILLPLSFELNVTPQLGADFPDEPVLLLLTALTIIKMVHESAWFPRTLSVHPLFLLLLLHVAWILITCLYATDPLLSCKYLLAKTWYIIPFVLLPQRLLTEKSQLRKMAVWLLVAMLFVTIQALLRHSLYGFSFESVKYIYGPFFRNHVAYSAMLVCLLAVACCVWKLTPTDHPKRSWILYGILIGLAGLFFAYSRGAWMALLLGVIGAWVIRKKLMGWLIAAAVITIIISTAWLVTDKNFMRFAPNHDQTVFHTDFSEHMAATVNMKDVSTAERFYRWVAGARMIAEKPVTGFGPNSFYQQYRPYTVKSFETWVSGNPEHSTVHNYFLLIALEQGVIGLLLFCLLFFGMLLHAQKLYHRLQDPFYKTVALTVAVVLIMIGVLNFMSDMIETDKIGSLFWLCLGVIILLNSKPKTS